jgi:signal transduction histidine kinase
MGLVIIALLPVVAVLVMVASQRQAQAVEAVRNNTLTLARLAAANQQQLISGARDILITLTQVPAIQKNDRPACLFFLTNILMQHPLYANFGAANRDGEIFCMTIPQRIPINISKKQYFQDAIQNLDYAISDYLINPVNSQAIITLAYPIVDDEGEPQGIVMAELDLRWLYQFESAAALPDGAQLFVIDQTGTVLALHPSGEEAIGKPMPEAEVVELITTQNEGLIEENDNVGVSRLYAFTPLYAFDKPEVYLIVTVPTNVILAGPRVELILSLSALAIGALLALIAAWFGSNWLILRQVNELVFATRQLSKGDLSVRAGTDGIGGELSELARAFNEMTQALQEREAQHLLSQAQIRKQTQRANALAHVAGRLNAHLDLEMVLEAVCEEVSKIMNVPVVDVRLSKVDEQETHHFYANPEFQAASRALVDYDRLATFHASVHLGPPRIFELEKGDHCSGAENRVKAQSHFCQLVIAAMVHKGELIGYMSLYYFHGLGIYDDELMLLQGIADEAALAITNAKLYQALQTEERTRARLISNLITAQEDERSRIARELHDETSQSLTALMVGIDVLRMATQTHQDRVETYLQDQKAIAEEMLDNIQRLITDLRPALLDDLGLAPAITWYGDFRLSMCGIGFDFESDSLTGRVPRSIETALFRILQESITNVIRHSNATIVNARLVQENTNLLLEIADNGCGFDATILQHPDPTRGFGLRGMLERATILGGTFDLQTARKEGTRIRVTLPISKLEGMGE